MFSYWPPHIAEKKQGDHLEFTYSSSVRIRDVALRNCQKRWTIGRSGERGSGISVLVARQDDDDYTIFSRILFGFCQYYLFTNCLQVLYLVYSELEVLYKRMLTLPLLLLEKSAHAFMRVNLLSFLLRCSTRPHEWGAQWESNSLV